MTSHYTCTFIISEWNALLRTSLALDVPVSSSLLLAKTEISVEHSIMSVKTAFIIFPILPFTYSVNSWGKPVYLCTCDHTEEKNLWF